MSNSLPCGWFFSETFGVNWFSKSQAVEIEVPPTQTPEQRHAELPNLIRGAAQELASAALDESRFRATHAGHERIVNLQFQVAVNAMKSDFANPEMQKRISRTNKAKQNFWALNREKALYENPGLNI
jgi:hypothetical protein